MKTILCDRTAIEMWSRGLCADATPSRMKVLGNCAHRKQDIPGALFSHPSLTWPLHILVGDHGHRRSSADIQCHTWSKELPKKSICRLVDNIHVTTPEMSFLTASLSRALDVIDLIALGDELCGTYSTIGFREGEGHAGYDFYTRQALCTPQSLNTFLAEAGLAPRSKALAAAKWLVPFSRSPMETLTEMLLCLPPRLGGYGLPAPVMNASVPLPPHIAKLAGIGTLHPDLCWPAQKVALEYKGQEDHDEPAQRVCDILRENVLSHDGVTIISLTKWQFASFEGMRIIAKHLSGILGSRVKDGVRTEDRLELHRRLCNMASMRQELYTT
ncbi:MAG: hypothetical protein ACOYIP_01875 [Coriobacteriales bacterium]|jgi:hypothetical protein